MTATVARQRRLLTPRRRLVLAIFAAAALAAMVVHVRREPVPRCTTPEACVAGLDAGSTLVSMGGAGPPDVSLQPAADGSISLVGLDGTRHWRTSTKSTTPPRLVAAGDVGADGVTDYVVSVTRPLAAFRACGAGSVAETSLLGHRRAHRTHVSPVRGASGHLLEHPDLQLPHAAVGAGHGVHRRVHARVPRPRSGRDAVLRRPGLGVEHRAKRTLAARANTVREGLPVPIHS